ncbi:hypothetical protein B566_EDAN003768 [Ephemera danica]|nr:hypothetical protein B566_EDAN003768 [Ephemera danica]
MQSIIFNSEMTTIDPDAVAFIQLKVACNQVMQATSEESLKRLTKLMKSLPKTSTQKMQSHILFILMQLLQQKELSSKLKIEVTTCMEFILMEGEIALEDSILDSLMLCLMSTMYDPEKDNLVAALPEELHLGCIKCVALLLRQIKKQNRIGLFSPKRAPMLGVLVCICLKQASSQQLRSLRIASIECLMICAQVLENPHISDPDLRTKSANIFMNFLPGIAAGLQHVISGDEKQGHTIFVVAVRAWGRLLTQVLDDEALPAEESVPNFNPDLKTPIQEGNTLSSARTSTDLEQIISQSKRTPAWFTHADTKLMGNVRAVCLVHRHSHPKVRMELVHTVELLVTRCSRSLPQCVPLLLDALLILSEDEAEEVALVATQALEKLAQKCSEEHGRPLFEHLEESFYSLISSLPSNFIHAAPKLMETGASHQWCLFRHFSDTSISKLLRQVCYALGENSDLALLTSQLLAVFTDDPSQRAEAALLLNLILGTSYPNKSEAQLKSVQAVLKAYLDSQIWNVPLHPEEANAPLTLATVRRNIVQTCIITEGVALLTAVTGSKARRFLAHVLYPVLERAGSSLELVAQAGLLSLNLIASSLGHSTPTQLIREEADYFTHPVAVGLRNPASNPGALLVLGAVLTHSKSDILPCIETIILDRWLKEEQGQNKDKEMDKVKEEEKMPQMSLLVQQLAIHHKWKLETGENFENDMECEEQKIPDVPEEQEEPVNVPNYIKMTEAVMQRCTHVLPSPNKNRQAIALATLKIGIQILASHEDQLLPMVHRIWSPLLQRFSPSEDIVILRHSFELLCEMAHVAKCFLRKRTLDKVLPSISNFLKKHAEVSSKQRVETFSQGYKLQKTILDHLGQFCIDLQLQEEDIDIVMNASSLYLSSEQHPLLQESCIQLFCNLGKTNSDAVWLHLMKLWSPQPELQPPHPTCPKIKFPKSSTDGQHFKKNVEFLLSNLQ